MKVAVIGSRTFRDEELLTRTLDADTEITSIVSGGARGADTLAALYSVRRKVPLEVFLADWRTHGLSAGYIRNQKIIDTCDKVYAFWDGKSRGTQHGIRLAEAAGKPVVLVFSAGGCE